MRALGAAILVALLLAGCSGGSGGPVGKTSCPTAFVAPGLDAYTQLRPGATSGTLDDIAFGVKLVSVTAACRTEVGGIHITTSIVFHAVRNDETLQQGDFSYFVAIADPQQNILAKQTFGLRADFAKKQKQMRIADEITEHLPLKKVSTGGGYAVVVGMQLSPQQLQNREPHQP
jgi:hypothetical protein